MPYIFHRLTLSQRNEHFSLSHLYARLAAFDVKNMHINRIMTRQRNSSALDTRPQQCENVKGT